MPADHEQRVRGYLQGCDSFLAVAEESGRLVGMAVGIQAHGDDGTGPAVPGLCHISMVFVHPRSWGHGVGKSLMQGLLASGRSRGYDRFQLWTQADNHRARRLYEGFRFGRSGRQKDDELRERTLHYELPAVTTAWVQ
jgi:ribosomal protein S18 acetylase RimI-like enzyme